MAEANVIQEGFLCPICHKDLRSPQKLIVHFQDFHSEEQDVLKSIKEFYGKAKKKILKLDEQDLKTFKNELSLDNLYLEVSAPQAAGCSQSHTDFFKEIRRERLDHQTAETNKLIIRLDKLLRLDGADRKQQEQFLVAWLDGTTVTRCPSCAASFNIARRQHHCRLCGCIMCNDCSIFLPFDRAQSIVVPVQNVGVTNNREVSSNRDSDNFRICSHCATMLEHRRLAQAEQMMQPIICQLYAHLMKLKSQVQSHVDLYEKMYSSLTAGESIFQLQDAQTLKATIGAKAEMIDTISKKITNLPVDDSTLKIEAIQKNIRRATTNYIKDYLLSLPPLPSVQELAAMKENRMLKVSNEDKEENKSRVEVRKVTVTTGWSPSSLESSLQTESDDPLMEQINIVREYITQARKAQRFEEVVSLEENLRMLKKAYQQSKLTNAANR